MEFPPVTLFLSSAITLLFTEFLFNMYDNILLFKIRNDKNDGKM